MTGLDLDLDVIEARANAATEGPWWAWDRGVGYVIALGEPGDVDEYNRPRRELPEGMRTDIGREADAVFVAAARTDVPELAAELRRFQPVTLTTGCQLYIHDCRQVEWWNEERQGPINEQGCDACESAPYPGGWRLVYIRKDGAR